MPDTPIVFSRIAVVNRGEPAVRLIRAVRELNAEHGWSTRVVALHTEAESRALFVRQADEACQLRSTGAKTPYLDHAELERALTSCGADAVWVGWGFVAEDPAFADLCARIGVTFIGPPAESMRLLGDKVAAKILAEKVGVPVAPWSGGPVSTRADARRHAQAIGYPLIIKARSGGGGRGIRKVYAEDQLELALDRTQAEAEKSFGDPVVFIERLVTVARHVEVQVIADQHGNVWAPGVRDCSIQRKNQKVIEESSSPVMTKDQSDFLRQTSAELVKAAGYHGAGTVEFLYQPEQKAFTFLEVNTRLQVEHPITEFSTGLDLVKLQILVAMGERLEGDCPPEFGHAVEARLNAEDADNDFAAAPGLVKLLNFPMGPGIRIDSGIADGDVIPPDYDSMVAKVIAWGRNRSEAFARLRAGLRETRVVLDGGTTNKSFLLALLNREEVISGSADTGWLDRGGMENTGPSPLAFAALICGAISHYDAQLSLERDAFLRSARGGRPRSKHDPHIVVELTYQGQSYQLGVAQIAPREYLVVTESGETNVTVERLGTYQSRVQICGVQHHVLLVVGRGNYLIEVDSVTHRIGLDEGGIVRASAPSVIVSMPVVAGDQVESGDTVAILEAMKMEMAIRAPWSGRIRDVLAIVNTQVDAGAPLLRIDRDEEGSASSSTQARVNFDEALNKHGVPEDFDYLDDRHREGERARALLDSLRSVITGFDVDDERASTFVAAYEAAGQLGDHGPELISAELGLLSTFADICELTRGRSDSGADSEQAHNPRENFYSYLLTFDADAAGVPAQFKDNLARALSHYGATLDQGPVLEAAVHRLFIAVQRADDQVPLVAALLDRWNGRDADVPRATPALAETLDRMITATSTLYPLINELARIVRFRYFNEPSIRESRVRAYRVARRRLDYLSANPDAANYREEVELLASTPEPLFPMLAQKVQDPGLLLEVVTRQYYRIHTLTDVVRSTTVGAETLTGTYEQVGERIRLSAGVCQYSELATVFATLCQNEAVESNRHVVDLYVAWPEAPSDGDAFAQQLLGIIGSGSSPACRRFTVTVFGARGVSHQVTLRWSEAGVTEDRLIRDIHPLNAQRLQLWRLKNFDGTRLSAPPDTHLYYLTAKENPSDRRLLALAEVREEDFQRGAAGDITAAPATERAISACVDGIRRERAVRGDQQILNSVVHVYIWPVIDARLGQLDGLSKMVASVTLGTGIDEVMIMARVREQAYRPPREVALTYSYSAGAGLVSKAGSLPTEPIQPLDSYAVKVRDSRRRGCVYPYELIPLLTGEEGTFIEYDFDASGRLAPVERPVGQNAAGIVVGVIVSNSRRYPEGMTRVGLFGDPTKALGTVSQPECERVIAALDLATSISAPVEWFALSSGATISMQSGTENMDWVARALRRIITFTQGGGEINVIVAGINVGAQPYWNAEATMLTHTKGILIMTPDSAMVLTGKRSLDFAGGVSAEDNFGIGGYDRVMGPNGEAQYWVPNLNAACSLLLEHYEHSYVAPGERFPRRAFSTDPVSRDIRHYPHTLAGSDFTTVGDIFSLAKNAERKKPFDIRTVLRSVTDQDQRTLERWADMAGAETSVVYEAHIGGYPVVLIGIESKPVTRKGWFPADGPDQWTSGTLFPQSSKKTARAINAASGNRPVVVLANLSGFDGSPESLRKWQLEYGAEIGRAIVNFDGPIVFCVISRYHGGAFVVFSGALRDNMEVLAVEGSYASVLGGAPAAAVVFTRDVDKRAAADPRVREAEAAVAAATDDAERAHAQVEASATRAAVRAVKLGEVAAEFDAIHSIQRALEVGSVHSIVAAADLRPSLIAAVERGIARTGTAGS